MREIIRKVLLETKFQKRNDLVKKSLFKLWDREKSMNRTPKLSTTLSQSLGISFYELQLMLMEWYGGAEKIFNSIKDSLENKIISTDDLMELEISVGGYDFTFKIPNVRISNHQSGGYEMTIDLKIIDGGVTTITDGEYIDLTDVYSMGDSLWWEISWEIKDLIKDLIRTIIDKYGFNSSLDQITINFI
jgi:hypothetical protein